MNLSASTSKGASAPHDTAGKRHWLQRRRAITQVAFFVLFIAAPPLDLLRLDLDAGHAIFLTQPWTLGFDALQAGTMSETEVLWRLLWAGFIPVLGTGLALLWVAWRYGRLYCGWLCPHFSVVELINGLMRRASARPSLWERKRLPEYTADGASFPTRPLFWLPTVLAIVAFSALWAITLLTYLQPPEQIYSGLLNNTLTRNQMLFIGVGTTAFAIEFTFARHLFCRFGCAVGLAQSIAWMANRRSLVVTFNTAGASACRSCDNACEHACPMRLKPRGIKRAMFTCTSCAQCLSACAKVNQHTQKVAPLEWVSGDLAARSPGVRKH